jgi:hypothetical protein
MPQARDWCDEFHDLAGALSSSPAAVVVADHRGPSPFLVQLPQVVSAVPVIAVPSGCEPGQDVVLDSAYRRDR